MHYHKSIYKLLPMSMVIIICLLLSSIFSQPLVKAENENIFLDLNETPEDYTLLSMGFEQEWITNEYSTYLSPPEWTIRGICKSHQEYNSKLTHYWSFINTDFVYTHTVWPYSPLTNPFIYSGNYAAAIWGNDGYKESPQQKDQSDEWIITPVLDLSSYYDISLSFWSIYVPTQQVTIPFPQKLSVDNQYLIKTSNDRGDTWKKMADLRNPTYKYGVNNIHDVYNNYDQQIIIDLDHLTGSDTAQIAWHYDYNGNGTSDLWIIDDITIQGKYDDISPAIEIVKPLKNNLYFFDSFTFPLSGKTIVIGSAAIDVDPTDIGTGTAYVEFYVDNTLLHTDDTYPFSWTWNEPYFGSCTIKTKAYDFAGNSNSDQITIFKIL